jgi:geranylgeranyl pyrophosphate synthase
MAAMAVVTGSRTTASLSGLPAVLAALRPELERLEARLRNAGGVEPEALQQLLDWVFASGGKRIRPALVFAIARLGGGVDEAVVNLAAGIETLHAASLVHDDLVDGSLTRRGMATVNKRWSAGATVLAGDWLFARAAAFVADTEDVAVIKIFARTLGTISDGELRQLFGRAGAPSAEQYEYRIYAKTASLFEAATESAGHLIRAGGAQIEALTQFGRELGMAFQIADDLLDFVGDPQILGKPVGSDLRSGQVTLPALLYLDQRPDAAPRLRGAVAAPSVEDIDRLVAAVRADSAVLEATRAAADQRRASALAALEAFPPSVARDELARIADYVVARNV